MSVPTPPTGGGAYAPDAVATDRLGVPERPAATGHGLGADSGADVGDASLGDLIGNVTRDLSTLVRQELALARAEVKQEVSKTAKGAGALAGAGLAGFFVLLFLSTALYAGLSNVMDAGWAALIVAVLWAVVAGALFVVGRSAMQRVNPKPERTVDTLSNVPDALKGNRGGPA